MPRVPRYHDAMGLERPDPTAASTGRQPFPPGPVRYSRIKRATGRKLRQCDPAITMTDGSTPKASHGNARGASSFLGTTHNPLPCSQIDAGGYGREFTLQGNPYN